MVYPARKTTITHSNGTDIPNIQIEDDIRHPNAAKRDPAELHQGTTWKGYTDFTVRPAHGHTRTLPSIPETKTTEPRDEDMPQTYGSASWTSTSEIQEAQYGFTGPTAHLELGTP